MTENEEIKARLAALDDRFAVLTEMVMELLAPDQQRYLASQIQAVSAGGEETFATVLGDAIKQAGRRVAEYK